MQTTINALALVITGRSAWKDMMTNHFISLGALLFYGLVGLVVLSFVRMARGNRSMPQGPPPAASSQQPQLTPVDLVPESSPASSQWTYKSKVRIFLRNDTGADIVAANPRWRVCAYGLPVQAQLVPRLQLEGPNGWDADDWPMPELAEVRVPPGRVFRIWIGLNLDISMGADRRNTEIRRRAVTRTLGVLEMTVRMHGVGHEWTMGF